MKWLSIFAMFTLALTATIPHGAQEGKKPHHLEGTWRLLKWKVGNVDEGYPVSPRQSRQARGYT